VVLSVFVNPSNVGPGEDLERYPRLPRDGGLAEARGVAAAVRPQRGNDVSARSRGAGGAGRRRPAAGKARCGRAIFTGVLTVVAKLFHLVGPDIAFFGQRTCSRRC
jgi:pantoate--beta-alanine ligase